jgi:hypothetical protein
MAAQGAFCRWCARWNPALEGPDPLCWFCRHMALRPVDACACGQCEAAVDRLAQWEEPADPDAPPPEREGSHGEAQHQ